MKNKILILNGQYLPGFKGGGPIQSIANLVSRLCMKYEFYIMCSDRDFKSKEPYKNVEINKWNDMGDAKVFYADKRHQSFSYFKEVINSMDFDYIYLNGFFSPIFTLKPLILKRFNRLNPVNIILTSRGDFTGGIKIKRFKKEFFITFSKLIGLYDNVIWQATSEMEKRNILTFFSDAKIEVIPNLPTNVFSNSIKKKKEKDVLKLINVSRIVPKKNLKFVLEILSKVRKGKIYLDIYGPIEDEEYWNECKKRIQCMPDNVVIKYCGELSHQKVIDKFKDYDFFFFPTLGENYGHVIIESLLNGCPVILSKNTTPWDIVGENGGDVIDLENKKEFENRVRYLVNMENDEYVRKVLQVTEFSKNIIKSSADSIEKEYIRLFSKKGKI